MDDDVCEKSAEALGKIGPDAKAAIPALIQTLGRVGLMTIPMSVSRQQRH